MTDIDHMRNLLEIYKDDNRLLHDDLDKAVKMIRFLARAQHRCPFCCQVECHDTGCELNELVQKLEVSREA